MIVTDSCHAWESGRALSFTVPPLVPVERRVRAVRLLIRRLLLLARLRPGESLHELLHLGRVDLDGGAVLGRAVVDVLHRDGPELQLAAGQALHLLGEPEDVPVLVEHHQL